MGSSANLGCDSSLSLSPCSSPFWAKLLATLQKNSQTLSHQWAWVCGFYFVDHFFSKNSSGFPDLALSSSACLNRKRQWTQQECKIWSYSCVGFSSSHLQLWSSLNLNWSSCLDPVIFRNLTSRRRPCLNRYLLGRWYCCSWSCGYSGF